MKRSAWLRIIAVILIISMVAAPVSAAGAKGSTGTRNHLIGNIADMIRDLFRDRFGGSFGQPGEEPTTPSNPVDPTTPTEPDETEPEESEPEISLELIEGHANTLNGQLLRGVTYSLTEVLAAQSNPPFSLRNNGFGATSLGGNTAGSLSLGRVPLNALAEGDATAVSAKIEGITGNGSSVDTTEPAHDKSVGNAFDGNNNTFWATVPGGNLADCYLIADLGSTYTIDKVTYTKRHDTSAGYNCTGNLLDYIIEVSTDGTTWTQVASGATVNGTTEITFTAVEATHVRLRATQSYHWQAANANTVMTCAEFEVYGYTESTEEPDTIDPADDSRDIPTSVLTATSNNYQSGDDPDHVLDGNNSTIWHTVHRDSERDTHWIQFTLSESYTVDGLRYLPRQNGTNGTITEYQVLVSNDGETWTEVATGTWAGDISWKIAQFEGQDVKYVRLKVVNALPTSGNKFASAAEIRLTGVKNAESEEPESETKLVYFPVTMFNYDEHTMNTKTHSMYPTGSTLYNGIHFSDGNPERRQTFEVTAHTGEYANGQYVIQNFIQKDHTQPSWLTYSMEGEKGIIAVADQAEATRWTLTRVPGANVFTLTTEIDGTTYYMTFGNETSGVTTEYSEVTLVYYTHTNEGIQLRKDGYYLGHSVDNLFCGSTNSTSTSNGMAFFPVDENGNIAANSLSVTTINGAVTSGYSRWNYWSYLEDGNVAQNKFFAELVQHELDSNGDIVFNVPEPGIFKTGTGDNIADKDVYTNVGLPFVLDETTGIYSFDSDRNGVYFPDKDGDGDSDPASGTETNLELLQFDPGAPQSYIGITGDNGDGSSNLWIPYNVGGRTHEKSDIDYHFGMRADIPFSMTPNGRIKSTDDNSTPITFTFSGDDDVWVFIDGHLVIDLGGIHNRIGATIDFANNTITYFLPESNTNTSELGCYNDRTRYPVTVDENGKQTITVKLYNDAEGEGSLGQTRNDFASEEAHSMSIFYMERGKGTSNCHIEFNLPMRDTLLITKDATKSWSEQKDKEDGEDGDGTDYLTAKEQAAVDKLNFGFTLYKKTADETEFTAVTNTNFFVQDKTGKVIATSSTDGNGKFYLKNGQTAKFMTDIPKAGITYYVVEDAVPEGFLTPDYKYAGAATWGYDYSGEAILKDENGDYILDAEGNLTSGTVRGTVTNAADMGEHELPMDATENKSYEVTVKGSVESIDSIEFICTNYLDAELPNPSALANEDIIVIDYGLPVQIDPLANDLFRGDNIEIVAWGDESLTLNEVKDESGNNIPHDTDGGTNWTGNKIFSNTTTGAQTFDSGNVTFTDVTYAEHAQEITNDDGTTTTTYTYTRDSFEYELTKQLTEVEEIRYIIKVTSTETQDGTGLDNTACRYSLAKVYIVPATIMYYEENFSDMITFKGDGWDDESTESNQNNVDDFQEPGVVGTIGDSTYGSDVAYLNDNGDSNGTHLFGDTTNGAIRFTYTFTGTGTSIFARTSANTGYMQVKIYEGTDTTGEYLDISYRDTYYEDTNGTELDSDGTLYNIPVYTQENLAYGTYTVVCTVAKKGTLNAGPVVEEDGVLVKRSGGEFYLDGIRVLQPLDIVIEQDGKWDDEGNLIQPIVYDELTTKALEAYATDGEANLDVVTLRYKLITDVAAGKVQWDGENFVVLTDTNGAITTAADYESFGPKEEVYLAPGQKVSFSLKYWQPEGLKLYMGMKAPFGSAKVNIGHNAYDLNNAPDCYYDVTEDYASLNTKIDKDGNEYYVVTYTFEAAESIVSLTNIKVVGNYVFTIIENNDIGFPGDNGEGEDTDIDITDPEGDGEDNTNP